MPPSADCVESSLANKNSDVMHHSYVFPIAIQSLWIFIYWTGEILLRLNALRVSLHFRLVIDIA